MIVRHLGSRLRRLAGQFPVVWVTGPRQSGKTTLCRQVFADIPYVSLEAPDFRHHARADPRGFLAAFPGGAVLDEFQRVPELASWLQGVVDDDRTPGRWILTGSANFSLVEGVSQSLAGRAAMLTLLPLSLAERPPEGGLWETVLGGGYPAIGRHGVTAADWLAAYVATYVERDVRQLSRVGDLTTFDTFVGLVAGRSGQIVNQSALGADAGVATNTARAWLTVLEASWLVHRVGPWAANHNKRMVKSPKLEFVDSGLLCWLLGIRSATELRNHPLRGPIFESWVASEVLKARCNRGQPADLHFYAEHAGPELDLLVGRGLRRLGVEVKSGATVVPEWFRGLNAVCDRFAGQNPPVEVRPILVYGGEQAEHQRGVRVLPWHDVHAVDWADV